MRNKTDDLALSEDEIALLRNSTTVPEEIRHFLARQHDNVGTKVSAYRKVAAAARAERDALFEVRLLAALKSDYSAADDARREANALREENHRLVSEVERQRELAIRANSRDAIAVHSEVGQ